MNRILFYLALITFSANLSNLLEQNLEDSLYNTIPLEVYEGFEHDTFTLHGESEPRQVFKVGVHKSSVKVYLEEVGEVFVHHVLNGQYKDYYVEIYSRQPSSGFIEGIWRYGHYRVFVRQSLEAEDRYNGNTRIEFVSGLNTIVRSVNQRCVFKINGEKEMFWREYDGELTLVSFKLDDCSKYVDTTVFGKSKFVKSGNDCTLYAFIEFGVEKALLKVNLQTYNGSEAFPMLVAFESVIFDTLGHVVGRVSEAGSVNRMILTDNHEYVYISSGGQISENISLPYTFKIVELKTGEVLFERSAENQKIEGFFIEGTDLSVYLVEQSTSVVEAYVFDLGRNIMYPIHHHALCQPPFTGWYFEDYCVCRGINGLDNKLYYDKDFTAETFIKK